ncbi:allophycocyanin, beta subunit [[Leptolyngbya] sp. PCC 7376]|uniref:allophycocyanin subunit beta n=1 Tax=[Leptolyngbya] sp. PCC 7376 TaxID=111781 RepID=UPI00029F43E2|nr:allophycocyanin subunit beta [[Leptolyngbya] sp. PCC 7376]AFY38925.1 allophycocyanin, beta subunit [[Leptolyngbya] sp. PCC 7376]
MQDAVTSLIRNYDTTGRYLDSNAIDNLKSYFATGADRITTAAIVNGNSAEIVKFAANQLFEAVPELLLAGGNAYTTRRYSACLRDMDYYLRYGTYAIIAGNNDILNERVLQGLRETYNSLSVPIGPTVRGIQFIKEAIKSAAAEAGIADTSFIDEPFEHMIREFSEVDI